jgi:hypothetical protein
LERVKAAIDEKGHGVDALFFVGGFAQFYPVRKTIADFWKTRLNGNAPPGLSDQETSRFAISYGAALIANDLIQVEEKFEHTIGVEGYRLTPDGQGAFVKEACRIPIIVGGGKLSEYQHIHFAEHPVKAENETPDITIYVDPESRNRIVKERLPESLNITLPNAGVPGNQWKIGMWINRSKVVYLVFEDSQGARAEYELGDILRQMFGGLEILAEGEGR